MMQASRSINTGPGPTFEELPESPAEKLEEKIDKKVFKALADKEADNQKKLALEATNEKKLALEDKAPALEDQAPASTARDIQERVEAARSKQKQERKATWVIASHSLIAVNTAMDLC